VDTYRCAHNRQHPYLLSLRPDGLDQSLTPYKPNDTVVVRPTHNHCDDTADREASAPAAATLVFVAHDASILVIQDSQPRLVR